MNLSTSPSVVLTINIKCEVFYDFGQAATTWYETNEREHKVGNINCG